MVGHDATGFRAVVDAIAAKPDADYWRAQYGALHQENVNLKRHIQLLESWLRITDIYLDNTGKTLAHLQGLIDQITYEREQA